MMTLQRVLSASILSADFECLGEQIRAAEAAGTDWIHVDIMDGHFVPNISMGPFVVEACRQISNLPLDVHLMISNPDQYVEAFAQAGATHLSVHLEGNPHVYRTLQKIHSLGCKAGIVINPGTDPMLLSSVLPLADLVLVMTVNPGYSGQHFLPDMVAKVRQVRTMLDRLHSSAWLQVDGGINTETLPLVRQAGASAFVAATAIFKHPAGIAAGVHALRELMETD